MKKTSRPGILPTDIIRRYCCGFIIVALCLAFTGCTTMVSRYFSGTVDDPQGTVSLPGLKEEVLVMRDDYGIPYIEATNMEDLAFAIGYVQAADRLTQMTGLKLIAQGRFAEMIGPAGLDLDIYMRTIGLPHIAARMMENVSPENTRLLRHFSDGVNAWMAQHQDRMPPGIALSGYTPEAWEPMDSVSIFTLVNLALSFNLYEECATLNIAQAVGAEKTAWLLPVYPDESLPFEEAVKLKDVDLAGAAAAVESLESLRCFAAIPGLSGIATSNNWAISKERTGGGASILANDTHLMLSMPSLWILMHVKCGAYNAAGIGIAGLPAVVGGYNGHIAWGMTMVMADNQDIFLEQLKDEGGTLHYLYRGEWLPTEDRREMFRVKGEEPVTVTVRSTCHGPLLNDAVRKEPHMFFQPTETDLSCGIALAWAVLSPDEDSLDTFFSISHATSVDEVFPYMKRIRAIALNMVFADKDSIGWQVTGNYPLRAGGRGHIPSPGWTGEYDWTGLLDPSALPWAKNPSCGYIGTANNRTVPRDYPHILSSSWYWPERAERIGQMAAATERHTRETSMAMQLDTNSPLVPRLKKTILKGPLGDAILDEIRRLPENERKHALLAREMLEQFDGDMAAGSAGAAMVGALLESATRDMFLDELGPEDSRTWRAFCVVNNESYNATCDHLIVRGDESPFWDDVTTPSRETKAVIMARSLADAAALMEKSQGSDSAAWTWGALHTSTWETEVYKMLPAMGFLERTVMGMLSPYFNRGPYPAPGDYFTLNVSGYMMGQNFNTWLIPAMRVVVDFSREEPMVAVNSSGQSDNPSSPHYDDGITAWHAGMYIPFPFGDEAIRKQYTYVLVMTPGVSGK